MSKPAAHHHLIVTARVNNPPKEEDTHLVTKWMKEMIADIGMKILSGPHVRYVPVDGNKGITAVSIIEFSHCAMHVWEEETPARIELDVYTCKELDPSVVIEYMHKFDPVEIKYKFLDREDGLNVIHDSHWRHDHTM